MSNIQSIDTNANLLRAILWQYEGAPKLRAIVDAEQAYFDAAQGEFWGGWLRDVFDFNTASDFGLAVWARILDINLGVDAPASGNAAKFGFGVNNENFGAGNFGRVSAGELSLTTDQKRLVIRLRYAQITKRPTLPNINETLATVFADFGGVAYAVDNQDMTIEYLFAFTLPSSLKLVLEKYDLLLRPAGVGYTVSETVPMVLNELAIVLE
jgi:hypothetical protein